ncbi:hypothetical protein BC833DRAFT_662995 [Globomyces pollinis-pini]|nr:hypothetical protein BC833DRAFT_662995 [Globomyces pollinis-pini]
MSCEYCTILGVILESLLTTGKTQFIRNELTVTAKAVTWFWLTWSRSAHNLLSDTGSDNTTVNWDDGDTLLLDWLAVFDWFAVGFLVAVGHFVIAIDAIITLNL